jgi:spore germination cell wall hydrolase CwlJ-like protein
LVIRKAATYFLVLMLFVSDIPVVSEATYKPSLKDQEFFASMKCLSDNAFFEARGTSRLDMQAVTEVVINRSKSGKYPSGICKVIYQKYQFSWANKGYNKAQDKLRKALRKPSEAREYKQATLAAYEVLSSTEKRLLSSKVLWYHSHKVNPVWNKGLKKVQVNSATLHVLNQDKPLVHAFWYQPN